MRFACLVVLICLAALFVTQSNAAQMNPVERCQRVKAFMNACMYENAIMSPLAKGMKKVVEESDWWPEIQNLC